MNKKIIALVLVVIAFGLLAPTALAAKSDKAREPAACNDKADNDGDGLTDWPDDPDARINKTQASSILT